MFLARLFLLAALLAGWPEDVLFQDVVCNELNENYNMIFSRRICYKAKDLTFHSLRPQYQMQARSIRNLFGSIDLAEAVLSSRLSWRPRPGASTMSSWYDDELYGWEDQSYSSYFGGKGGGGSHHPGGADPRAQNSTEYMTAAVAMLSHSKVPPYWTPDLERRGYPFRVWVQDVGVRAAST